MAVKKGYYANRTRCPICHRQQPVKNGVMSDHASGSRRSSGVGKPASVSKRIQT